MHNICIHLRRFINKLSVSTCFFFQELLNHKVVNSTCAVQDLHIRKRKTVNRVSINYTNGFIIPFFEHNSRSKLFLDNAVYQWRFVLVLGQRDFQLFL